MYITRPFCDEDLSFVQQRDFILSLELQYDGDFDKGNAVTVTDGENVAAVMAIEYHSSWYADCKNNLIVMNYVCGDNGALQTVTDAAAQVKARLAARYPQKHIVLTSFIMDSDREELQRLLHCGFCFGNSLPVLAFDLGGSYSHSPLPQGVTIERVGRGDEEVSEYIAATALANDGVPDSIAQYRFRQSDESFLSFRAVYGGKTVGGITVWNIGEDGAATENIFTVPQLRRMGIASELIYTAFDELKARGKVTATLSMLGGNANAMRLYQKIGYKLSFMLYQLRLGD